MAQKPKLMIRVIVSNVDTAKQAHNRIINHNDRHDRVWLARTCTWALNNSHDVLTTPDLNFEFGIES